MASSCFSVSLLLVLVFGIQNCFSNNETILVNQKSMDTYLDIPSKPSYTDLNSSLNYKKSFQSYLKSVFIHQQHFVSQPFPLPIKSQSTTCKLFSPANQTDWILLEGVWYKVFSDQELTWFDSQIFCQQFGGTLVVDHYPYSLIQKIVNSQAYQRPTWVGLKKNTTTDEWIWLDGEYDYYVQNDDLGYDCGTWYNFFKELYADECTTSFAMICQVNKTLNPKCRGRDAWRQIGETCYKVISSGEAWRTWPEAKKECEKEETHLVIVADVLEQRDLSILLADFPHFDFWMGLSENSAGQWEWVDGSHLSFTYWEPTYDHKGDNLSAVFFGQADFSWVKIYSNLVKPFVCEDNISPCESDWSYYNGSCYIYSEEFNPKSWDDSRVACANLGSYLVMVETPEEDEFVHEFIDDAPYSWIGLKYNSGGYQWTTGDKLGVYSNFSSSVNSTGDCVIEYKLDADTYVWTKRSCSSVFSYICEKDKLGNTVTSDIECDFPGQPNKWYRYQDQCYMVDALWSLPYDSAAAFCKDLGANMVSIHSYAENNFLKLQMRLSITDTFWIGLSTLTSEDGTLQWEDKSDIDYTNFPKGWPDLKKGSCVYESPTDGLWRDSNCGKSLHFACKRPDAPYHPIIATTPSPNYCPDGWYVNGDYCYHLSIDFQDWTSASETCRASSANLVSIHNFNEQALVELLMTSSGEVWTGLRCSERNGACLWSDETDYDFKNWGKAGKPSLQPDDQSCVLLTPEDGSWKTGICNSILKFICKKHQ